MHRLFVHLLLLLLPLQLSWGVAAAYCGHEAAGSASAAHFGHHAHVHVHGHCSAQTDQTDQGDQSAHGAGLQLPGSDADCQACQGAPGVMMPAMPTLASVGPTITDMPWSAPELPAPPPARLERPNWHDLA